MRNILPREIGKSQFHNDRLYFLTLASRQLSITCEQPRGKGTPGYGDLIFYDQYLRRYEQLNER